MYSMELRLAAAIVLLAVLVCNVQSEVSRNELSQLMQTLWNSDTNRLNVGRDIYLNLQGKASFYNNIDRASGR